MNQLYPHEIPMKSIRWSQNPPADFAFRSSMAFCLGRVGEMPRFTKASGSKKSSRITWKLTWTSGLNMVNLEWLNMVNIRLNMVKYGKFQIMEFVKSWWNMWKMSSFMDGKSSRWLETFFVVKTPRFFRWNPSYFLQARIPVGFFSA